MSGMLGCAMRSPWLLAAVLAALGAAGYAFHTLSADDPGRSTAGADREPSRERSDPSPTAPSHEARRGGIKPALATAEGDARARGGPPPKIEPSVSLQEAREDFEAVLTELDALATSEQRLTNEAWVELYKRGNDALLPLQQHLEWSDPAEADELRKAQTSLREKLHAIAPGGASD